MGNHLTKYEQLQCENNALRDIIASMKRANRQQVQDNAFLRGKVAGMELVFTLILQHLCDSDE